MAADDVSWRLISKDEILFTNTFESSENTILEVKVFDVGIKLVFYTILDYFVGKSGMDFTDYRGSSEDVLGFTNQTAVLLSGMGAKDLLPQFKQRNISTEVLAELTIDDLQLLGADPELANHIQKELIAISKRTRRIILTPVQRLNQLLEALINNNKHLSLIQAFVTYSRLRINKEKIDSFIDRNRNLRSSKALELAIEATICEIQEARLALEELELFLEDGKPSKRPNLYIAMIGGVGLIALIILKKSI